MSYSIHQLRPSVYHIADPQGVFMTVIVGEEKALLFDTGYGIGHLDKTIAEITDLPLIVVNSHGHLDHVLGNRFFAEAYLHPADLQIYHRHTSQDGRRFVVDMLGGHQDLFAPDFSSDDYLSESRTELLPIVEGEVIDLGGVHLTVVHVPGHTPGGIALLNDRDRLLLVGDAASFHVWMFLQESTSIATYIHSLQKLQKQGNQYDGVIASHVPVLLPNDLIDRLIHCAEHIDPERSVPFEPPLGAAGKGIMYFEGLESLKKGLELETLDLAAQPFYTLDLEELDFTRVEFVSIVYDETKL